MATPLAKPKWPDIYAPPASLAILRSPVRNWDDFLNAGARIAASIHDALDSVNGRSAGGDSLELGCGAGRVLLPMRYLFGLPTHGCDINEQQIEFLQSRLPAVEFAINTFSPPTPYPDDKFALVYAVSVWTHMTPEDQVSWLREARRILRPGGVLAFSVAGITMLNVAAQLNEKTFGDIGVADVERDGIIHRDYDAAAMGKNYDVMRKKAPTWGRTVQSEAYTRKVFGRELDVVGYFAGMIGGRQDLVVLRKAEGDARPS